MTIHVSIRVWRYHVSSISPARVLFYLFCSSMAFCLGSMPCLAQAPDGFIQYRVSGSNIASAFQQWRIPVLTAVQSIGVPVTVTLADNSITLLGGPTIAPLVAGHKYLVADASGATQQIEPSRVNCTEAAGEACTLTAVFSVPLAGQAWLESGSHGLQEAVDNQALVGGTVLVTPGWEGSTADITGVVGVSAVQIRDERSGQTQIYSWTGNSYAPLLALNASPNMVQARSFENTAYADQWCSQTGILDDSCITNALKSLPPTGGLVHIPSGVYTISSSIQIPSNVTIDGDGPASILKASAALGGSITVFSGGVSHAALQNVTIDGNRTANSNTFFGVAIYNASSISIHCVTVQNIRGNAFEIGGGSTHIVLSDDIADDFGQPLPSQNGFGFSIAPDDYSSAAISDVELLNDTARNGNFGFNIYNSGNPSVPVNDVVIEASKAYQDAGDGFRIQTLSPSGGSINGARISDSVAYCNGWPGSPGFPAQYDCTPGALQNGPSSSSFGVGFDLIGILLNGPQLLGNRAYYNLIDGFSIDGRRHSAVNVTGTTVDLSSGTPFDTQWPSGTPLQIGGRVYILAGQPTATSLTVTQAPGDGGNLLFSGPSNADAIFAGNTSAWNGSVQGGTGFWNDSSNGDVYSSNSALANWNTGFGCNAATGVSYSNDQARENNQSNGPQDSGFWINGCLQVNLQGDSASDSQAVPTQHYGLHLTSTTEDANVSTSSLTGSTASILNEGSNNAIRTGLLASGGPYQFQSVVNSGKDLIQFLNPAGLVLGGIDGSGNFYTQGSGSFAALTLNGDASYSSSPRMVLPGFSPGPLVSPKTIAIWTPDRAIVVTRVEVLTQTAPVGCTTNASIELGGGSAPVDVVLTSTHSDSGVVASSFGAQSTVTVAVKTPASGCSTVPADATVFVQYRMQ